MSDLATLLAIGGAFVIVASSPGLANLGTANPGAAIVAIAEGLRTGIIFALGLAAGLANWCVRAGARLGAILVKSVKVLIVMRVLGRGCFLWLAGQPGLSR